MSPHRHLIVRLSLSLCCFLLVACATSSIESRRAEKAAAYNGLPANQKAMVDSGQIQIGMTADAVYIAWGKPSDVLESEDATGRYTAWHYYGSFLQENRYWAYREVNQGQGRPVYLERYLTSDYTPRDFVRSEIIFKSGRVLSWRTLPKPTY